MGRHKRFHNSPPKFPFNPAPKRQPIIIDQGSVDDINRWIKFGEAHKRFWWEFHSCLAYQRSKIAEEIKQTLQEATFKNFDFSNWQRIVRYKYSLTPFSVVGSMVDPAGGRFNIGDINPDQFSPFPALYVAKHRDTALEESLLCRKPEKGKESEALDSALADPTSLTNVSLSGHLESIIDLRDPIKLQPFVDLIKHFSVPEHVDKLGRQINQPISVIKTIPTLIDVLMMADWRLLPMQFDVPGGCQIFGQLVSSAGIDGILYPSKFTGKECLAIFPHNFDESFIVLDDEAPPGTQLKRLDAETWRVHKNELQGQ